MKSTAVHTLTLGRAMARASGRNDGLEDAAKLVSELARNHEEAVATYEAAQWADEDTKRQHQEAKDLAERYTTLAGKIRMLKTEAVR